MKGTGAKRLLTAISAVSLLGLLSASAAVAAPAVSGEFPVSELEANNKLVAGPDGNIWVTLSGATKNLARVTPAGEVKEFALPGVSSPRGIAVGPEGDLWVTENEGVAKFSPSNPEGTTVATTIAQVKAQASIVAGPDGNMWVATEEELIKFPPSDPEKFEAMTIAGLVPHDIDVAGSLLAIADAGAEPRIVTVTTAGTEKDYPIAGGSQGVAGSPSGQIGFSQQMKSPEQIGLITPPNPPVTTDLVGDPFGVAFGSDDAFWIVLFAKDGVERLTSTGQSTFLGGFPTGSMARQIAAGPGNTLWVTLTQNEHWAIGRISGLEPPVVVPPPVVTPVAPDTRITKGPKKKVKAKGTRAKVTFRFSSTTVGASFECSLVKAKKGKKGKKAASPHFKACASPTSFKLKPGKYQFMVRAVSAGLVDPSPAKLNFSVIRSS